MLTAAHAPAAIACRLIFRGRLRLRASRLSQQQQQRQQLLLLSRCVAFHWPLRRRNHRFLCLRPHTSLGAPLLTAKQPRSTLLGTTIPHAHKVVPMNRLAEASNVAAAKAAATAYSDRTRVVQRQKCRVCPCVVRRRWPPPTKRAELPETTKRTACGDLCGWQVGEASLCLSDPGLLPALLTRDSLVCRVSLIQWPLRVIRFAPIATDPSVTYLRSDDSHDNLGTGLVE